jgi:hypothetical protein
LFVARIFTISCASSGDSPIFVYISTIYLF